MLLDNEVCFKKVFITFFAVPDVCGDVWKYVAVDGEWGLQILNKLGVCIGRIEGIF